ncbi:MAG: thiamine phosphate synthase [Sodalis sp. Psp]|nr:thiamine phosphate synthase [Sodalis sp. Psp]MCR3756512.1 thiamine phosphate synthase [Sodalis sp. Ppy]
MDAKRKFSPVPYRLGLYPIVDSLAWLVRMLDVGVTTVQLRIKDRSETQIDADIEAAVLLGYRYNARVFINDYWRMAIHYGAYGVHLGQEDMDSADAGAIYAAGLRLGLSIYNETELARALAWQPSYIAFGHIFPTSTKAMLSHPQGLATLRRLATGLTQIPTVAIGGIGPRQAYDVLSCGVGSIAVASAIIHASDWRQATAALQLMIEIWEHDHGQ